jgi:hypothetical protein
MTFVTHPDDLRRKLQDNIKIDFIEIVFGYQPVIASCKHVNEPLVPLRQKLPYQLSDY